MTVVDSKSIVFVDTNVWLYGFIVGQDAVKSRLARQLIAESAQDIVISSQVVIEVVANLSKKTQLAEQELRRLIAGFYQDYQVFNVGDVTMRAASHLREDYSFSYWDSLIVAAATQTNATTLYSEDMHDGLVVNSRLTIVNPFLP